MDLQETKQIIYSAKNIYLITSQEPEAICSTLALFYTLKDLSKNVNLIIDSLPENLKFLAPSLDFVSYPKNFVLSIPNSVAEISQIYYEKNNDNFKIHLKLESGNIKKDNISSYFSEPKPDIIITIGIKNYHKHLSENLNSFGFLMGSPIINIDNSQNNQKFGKINILEDAPLSKTILGLTENLKTETSECLLAGLILYTNNFKNKVTAEIFEDASLLMKNGANIEKITNNIKAL